MSRTDTHRTETKSRLIFQNAICGYSEKKLNITDVLYREFTERDYGLDALIEIFENNQPSGKFSFLQFKGTSSTITKLKTTDFVSCKGISKSNLFYCRQRNSPVILVYISTKDNEFYFIDLQTAIDEMKLDDNETASIRIPITNNSSNLIHLFEIINGYYDSDDGLEPKIDYVIKRNDIAVDGRHRRLDYEGNVYAEGLYEDDKLIEGIEYNCLVRIVKGKLMYKPNCPEDPYDCTDDFEYERLIQYGDNYLGPFEWCTNEFADHGLENFYIVDFEVTRDTEQMINIRTLKQFLGDKKYRRLQTRIDAYKD